MKPTRKEVTLSMVLDVVSLGFKIGMLAGIGGPQALLLAGKILFGAYDAYKIACTGIGFWKALPTKPKPGIRNPYNIIQNANTKTNNRNSYVQTLRL